MRKAGSLTTVAILCVAAACLFAFGRPGTPNGDGLGYLRAARTGQFAPGHPVYVPLLRLLGTPIVLRAQIVSMACGVLGVALVAMRGAVFGAAGLAVSWAYWSSASDVEVYAPAVLCLIGVLVVRHRVARAVLGGAAIALHIEHVLLLPFLWVESGAAVAIGALALGGCAYAAMTMGALHMGVPAALRFVLSSSHGFRDPLWKAPAATLFGWARSLAFAPYPYEASVWITAAHMLVGAGMLALVCVWAFRDRARPDWPARSVIALVAPYAACGFLFFPSESERWLFLLPVFWMWADPALAKRKWQACAVLGALLCWNVIRGVLPSKGTDAATRAQATAALLRPGDLVIAPGHGFDELLDLDAPMPPQSELYLLSYYVGRDGRDRALAQLAQKAQAAKRVVLVRFSNDADPQGWKELALLGVSRAHALQAVHAEGATPLSRDVLVK